MYIKKGDDLDNVCENILSNNSKFYLTQIQRIEALEEIIEPFKKYGFQTKKPEIIDLCEFIKYSIRNYKDWILNQKKVKNPIGIVYHIPSSNILLMPFYSWIPSFLCGNHNFIRISNSIDKKIIENLVEILDIFLGENYKYSQIFFEDTPENIISELVSFNCDARIIWGSDQTINYIKKSQKSNAIIDVAFRTRFSAAVIDCNFYLKKSKKDKEKVAKLFLNDSLNLSFNACSSPHLIFFRGEQEQFLETKKDFFQLLLSNKAKDNFESGIISTENIFKTQKAIIEGTQINIGELIFGRSFIEKSLLEFSKMDLENLYYSNFIIRFDSEKDLAKVWKKDIQTLTYFLENNNEFIDQFKKNLVFKSPDRIVPIGNALKFDVVWDGINFFEILTKQNIFHVPTFD